MSGLTICPSKRFVYNESLKEDIELNFLTFVDETVEDISITSPFLEALYADCLVNFRFLLQLQILATNVTFFGTHLFRSCGLLKNLYLKVSVTDLESSIFKPLKDLKKLILISKPLRKLPNNLFEDNIKLEHIEIRFSASEKLDVNMFSKLENLRKFLIYNYEFLDPEEPLMILNENNFIKNFNLEYVSLLKLNLSECSHKFFEQFTDVAVLKIKNSLFYGLCDQNCKHLFRRAKKLKSLIISNALLSPIMDNSLMYNRSLKNLIITNSDITYFSSSVVRKNNSVSRINLRANMICELGSSFRNNMNNLLELNLESNQIEAIGSKCFQETVNLKVLLLSKNKIETIADDTFSNLNSLEVLNLSKNRLKNLYFCLKTLNNLTYLNVAFNQLFQINSNSFNSTVLNSNQLKFLIINNNKIEKIDSRMDNLVRHLFQFRCQHNKISLINFISNSQSFRQLSTLNLSKNLIQCLPNDCFKNLALVKNINLSYNLIKSLNSKLFWPLHCLQSIDLSNNLIAEIPINMFKFNTWLRNVILKNNTVTTLSIDFFAQTYFTYLDVTGNSFESLNIDIVHNIKTLHRCFIDQSFIDVFFAQIHDPKMFLQRNPQFKQIFVIVN